TVASPLEPRHTLSLETVGEYEPASLQEACGCGLQLVAAPCRCLYTAGEGRSRWAALSFESVAPFPKPGRFLLPVTAGWATRRRFRIPGSVRL
ncbi:hypothetical protein NDU88_002619, partial [Pleurodeles waltl]